MQSSASNRGTRTSEGSAATGQMTAEIGVPRYHFHIYDGKDYIDKDGFELLSWEQARHEAIRLAGEIFQHTAGKISSGEDWRMEVTDEKSLILFCLDFTVLDAAAVPPKNT